MSHGAISRSFICFFSNYKLQLLRACMVNIFKNNQYDSDPIHVKIEQVVVQFSNGLTVQYLDCRFFWMPFDDRTWEKMPEYQTSFLKASEHQIILLSFWIRLVF